MKKKPTVVSTTAVTSVQLQSSSITDANKEDEKQEQLLQRKMTIATEGFATIKYPEKGITR